MRREVITPFPSDRSSVLASVLERPARFPSPHGPAHPLAVAAARDLMTRLPQLRDGKMFGVLVVEGGYLSAFSGMLDGTWLVEGFAPPAFDLAARDAFWIDGENELRARQAEIDAAAAARAELRARQAAEREALLARHRANRAERHASRTVESDAESRRDGAEKRELKARHAAEVLPDVEALIAARAARSRELLHAIQATYRIPLRALFAGEPAGGAGDCAAPKLLVWAAQLGLKPIALAEFWWGPGERTHGELYPACRGKCAPILPWLLRDLDAEAAPVFASTSVADPRVVFEDQWMAVVAKPIGLLSVPGRGDALRDSVLVRMRARWPEAMVVHRLDLDTSGLMLIAKDQETYARLQKMFALRAIDKRYAAWLDGSPAADAGTIELPLRVDLDDRPRQIVDADHGKRAITEWRVVRREGARTRVAFTPRTGRTHQLRVHAAQGLGAPIRGDRLYGRADDRLYLHAEALALAHPHTGARIAFEELAPW